MAQVTKNAFKGYSFQSYIYLLFACLMDTDKGINSIDAEVDKDKNEKNHNFDDMLINTVDDEFFMQIKNYKNLLFEDIHIEEEKVILGDNISCLKSDYKNIVVLYNCDIQINYKIFDLPAYKYNDVYIISLTTDFVCEFIDQLYQNDNRIVQICHFANKRILDSEFYLQKDELPPYKLFDQKLKEDTKNIRENFKWNSQGILFIIGKPGVGKSHFVNEFTRDMNNFIIYRFWISSQDAMKNSRLQYCNFIQELKYRVFKNAGTYTEEQLLQKIKELKITLIIDGLDHVENYNSLDIDNYFEFIGKLNGIHTIILTRPLKHSIKYDIYNLDNWNFSQTYVYLGLCHKIYEDNVCRKIFEISNGYPIICNYMARHYKLYGYLETTDKIVEINDYYSLLIKDTNTLSALSIFMVSNTYLSRQEIQKLLNDELLIKIIFEFIEAYPYLFENVLNRFSLIHDSFNTYLLKNNIINKEKIERYIQPIINSIRNNELRFLSRFNDLKLPRNIKKEVLVKYSDLCMFNQLITNNWDIEAIKEFYNQLEIYLKSEDIVLDIYQYYSFILIQECCKRIDTAFDYGIFYQLLNYLIQNEEYELINIFSSGRAFNIFKVMFRETKDMKFEKMDKILTINSNGNFKQFYQIHCNEKDLFYLHNSNLDYKKIICETLADTSMMSFDRNKKIAEVVVNLKINDNNYLNLKLCFDCYLKGIKSMEGLSIFNKFMKEHNFNYEFDINVFNLARYKLYQLGYLKEKNPFSSRIDDLFMSDEVDLYDISSKITDIIRLALINKTKIDIHNVNRYYLAMCYEKDISLDALPMALMIFEKHKRLNEYHSLEILSQLFKATNGLQYLLEKYINIKGVSGFKRLMNMGILEEKFDVNIFDLDVELINIISKERIVKEVYRLMKCHNYGRIIELQDVENGLNSTHRKLIKEMFERQNYKVMDLTTKISSAKSTPEEKGYIEYSDLDYIKEKNYDYLFIARYPDGYYNCFSDLELYNHYKKEDLSRNLLRIIHESMKCGSKLIKSKMSYSKYLGNIPCFLDTISYNTDWEKLYNIMMKYINISFFLKCNKIIDNSKE
ncbi:hypothetical protein FDF31_04800 [Clostridium sporogenes]|nr:hypothetical protein [Clostridium sporogenes]NFS24978.1 hypothetical protein [Clostridium sporogenes]